MRPAVIALRSSGFRSIGLCFPVDFADLFSMIYMEFNFILLLLLYFYFWSISVTLVQIVIAFLGNYVQLFMSCVGLSSGGAAVAGARVNNLVFSYVLVPLPLIFSDLLTFFFPSNNTILLSRLPFIPSF